MNILKKVIVLTMVLLVVFVGLVEAKSAEGYFRSGHTYYKKKDYDKAIQYFSKAIQLNQRTALFYQMRSNAYDRKGEYDKAIQDYSKAIQYLPEYYIYYASRGRIYEKTGEYDKAIQDFTKAIQLKPKDPDTYNSRGNVYADKGEYNKAIKDFTKAIQLGCKQFWPYDNAAWLYATSPDPEYRNGTKAVELAKKAISIEGEKSRVVATLAASYAEVGQFDDAVRTQKKAIKLAKKENSTYKNAVEAKEHLSSYEQGKPWREYPKQTIIFSSVFLTKNSRTYHKPNCTDRASKDVKFDSAQQAKGPGGKPCPLCGPAEKETNIDESSSVGSNVYENIVGIKYKYTGALKNNLPHGHGEAAFYNGTKYLGEWKDSLMHGQGTYTTPNGEKYVGKYMDGKKHGQGIFTYANEDKYVGEFKYGRRHGQGTYATPNGKKYVGKYKDGEKHGQGTLIYVNGSKYVGEWKNGMAVGGWYYWAEGRRIWCYHDSQGKWVANLDTTRF